VRINYVYRIDNNQIVLLHSLKQCTDRAFYMHRTELYNQIYPVTLEKMLCLSSLCKDKASRSCSDTVKVTGVPQQSLLLSTLNKSNATFSSSQQVFLKLVMRAA